MDASDVRGSGTAPPRCGHATPPVAAALSTISPAVWRRSVSSTPSPGRPPPRARPAEVAHAHRAVRHLPGRRAVPRRRPGHRRAAGAARPRGGLPARRRPAAGRCTSTPATSARRCRWSRHHVETFEPYDASSRRPGPASARCATSTRWSPAGPGDDGAGASGPRPSRRAPTSCPSSWSTCSASTDVGAYYPHRVTYHPTCHSLRMLRVGDKPLRLLRAGPRHRPGRAARRRPVLRLRRHVRAEERRHVDGDARRQDAQRARHRRRGRAPPATRPA